MKTRPTPALLRTGALAVATTALLASCGGGGGGGTAESAPTAADTSAEQRLQALVVSRGLLDTVRGGHLLAADVQNIIVLAPAELPAADTTRACTGGGTLTIRVLRPAGSPQGGAMAKRFDNCNESGVVVQGLSEVTYTRTVTESASQPWAGSVRFDNYVISSAGRQRSYHGLALAEGEVRGAGGGQPMTMRLTDFRLRDTPDTLGLGVEFTSAQFDMVRVGNEPAGTLYRLGGTWVLSASGLAATLSVDAGSTLSLLENAGSERLGATVQWQTGTLAPWSARVTVLPVGRSSLSVAVDRNQDGIADSSYTFERTTDLGLRL